MAMKEVFVLAHAPHLLQHEYKGTLMLDYQYAHDMMCKHGCEDDHVHSDEYTFSFQGMIWLHVHHPVNHYNSISTHVFNDMLFCAWKLIHCSKL